MWNYNQTQSTSHLSQGSIVVSRDSETTIKDRNLQGIS